MSCSWTGSMIWMNPLSSPINTLLRNFQLMTEQSTVDYLCQGTTCETIHNSLNLGVIKPQRQSPLCVFRRARRPTVFRSRDGDEPWRNVPLMTPLLPHFHFADVFKRLVFCAQCCVARLNKGACDALMFSMCLWVVFLIILSFFFWWADHGRKVEPHQVPLFNFVSFRSQYNLPQLKTANTNPIV